MFPGSTCPQIFGRPGDAMQGSWVVALMDDDGEVYARLASFQHAADAHYYAFNRSRLNVRERPYIIVLRLKTRRDQNHGRT